MSYKVRTIPTFVRELKQLSKKYSSLKADVGNLGESLAEDPIQGESLGRGCYKIRLAIKSKGKGKRGGARVITYVAIVDEEVVMLSIYDKSEQADIPDKTLDKLLTDNGLL